MKNMINEITLSYRKQECQTETINSSLDAVQTARLIYGNAGAEIEVKEYFFVILLNQANQVVGYNKLSEGGISGTVADIRLCFALALKSLACAMILVHNHPSGGLKPSEADKQLTKKFCEAGELLDIKVLDHIILTQASYCSFADDGNI